MTGSDTGVRRSTVLAALCLVTGCASGGGDGPRGEGTHDSGLDAWRPDPNVDAGDPPDAGPPADTGFDACVDGDGDGVCDASDACSAGDDGADADGDGVPDACDCDDAAASACSPDATCEDAPDGVACTCRDGFTGDGVTCTRNDCGAPPAPEHGSVSAPDTTFEAVASYACDAGYDLVGDATRTCLADGTWSGAAPSCLIGDCGPLASPENGSVSATATTVGSVATYGCAVGYTLVGSATRTCQADGSWSGSAPTCYLTDCGTLSPPANGTVTAPSTTYGSTATYACNVGHTLAGAGTRTCQADGSWSGTAPTCPIVDCGGLSAPANGSVSAPVTTYGATATYSCSPGFTLSGDTTRTCQASGAWSGSAPSCVTSGCGVLASPANGSVSMPGTAVGTVATHACNSGYQITGSYARRCLASLNWSGTAPACGLDLTCSCGGAYSEGDRVEAVVDSPASASGILTGHRGTIIAGNAPPSTLGILVQWDGWSSGHDGNCSVADCGTCTPSTTNDRWWVPCDSVRNLRLGCACGGAYQEGSRVVANVASPSGASGITLGHTGTVVAGTTTGSLPVLVQWDAWSSGHDGNCAFATCGLCTTSGSSRWWVTCEELSAAP